MAIDATFNSIIAGIQLSNLNFAVQLTPFAAYITLKRSTQIDKNGVHVSPSPPLVTLLQKSYVDLNMAQDEIVRLRASLEESNQRYEDLVTTNASLLTKLEAADDNLTRAHDTNNGLMKKVDDKENEVNKLEITKKDIANDLKLVKKEYNQYVSDTENQLKSLQKANKNKEKEMYNLKRDLANSCDTVSNLKSEVSQIKLRNSKLVKDSNYLNKQLKKLSISKEYISSSSQTTNTVDTDHKCTICGYAFESSSGLKDHNETYQYCCRTCFSCYRTVQEASHCCIEDNEDSND